VTGELDSPLDAGAEDGGEIPAPDATGIGGIGAGGLASTGLGFSGAGGTGRNDSGREAVSTLEVCGTLGPRFPIDSAGCSASEPFDGGEEDVAKGLYGVASEGSSLAAVETAFPGWLIPGFFAGASGRSLPDFFSSLSVSFGGGAGVSFLEIRSALSVFVPGTAEGAASAEEGRGGDADSAVADATGGRVACGRGAPLASAGAGVSFEGFDPEAVCPVASRTAGASGAVAAAGSFEAGSGAVMGALQEGHGPLTPAMAAGTRKLAPHSGHGNDRISSGMTSG
jgi:hypothetical protein